IFLLGYDIGFSGSPVIRVDPCAQDVAADSALPGDNEFIKSLHHRSWIVQIEQLRYHRRTDLEKLLSIFDQENRTKNHYILNVNEESFPEPYRPVIRRLRMAAESEDIQIEMEMEDDYLKELQDKEREIEDKDKTIEEQREALEEQREALEEQREALEEQKKVIEAQEKAFEEQRKALEEQRKAIEELKKQLAEKQK
ncbi:MAG: hypothetical protein LBB73_09890, partial [Dysgonamonadaceae bacterium]|nr:hypothetical protein [Dysgonamonadaceae bacterium]